MPYRVSAIEEKTGESANLLEKTAGAAAGEMNAAAQLAWQ